MVRSMCEVQCKRKKGVEELMLILCLNRYGKQRALVWLCDEVGGRSCFEKGIMVCG